MKNKVMYIITAFVLSFILTDKVYADTYYVKSLDSAGNEKLILETESYVDAKKTMNEYSSTDGSEAIIYRNDQLVSAQYALAWFNTDYDVTYLYQNPYDTANYTYTAPSYGVEAAFLEYNAAYNKAKIMISGFEGYVNMDRISIKPLVTLSSNTVTIYSDVSIKIRTCASTSCSETGRYATKGNTYVYSETKSSEGYTWYHINSGWFASADSTWAQSSNSVGTLTYYQPYPSSSCLIHYFMYGGYTDNAYTNLGYKPSYLENGKTYYSYDGNYFYTDIKTMLNDYRNTTRKNALNYKTPYYSYYMYLSTRSKTGYTADDLNKIISNMGYYRNKKDGVSYVDNNGNWINDDRAGMSVMYNTGSTFIEVQNNYGINAFEAFSTALNESSSGTSVIAFAKNNIFGIGATDSNPFFGATNYTTVADSIIGFGELNGAYANPDDWRYFGAFYGNKNSGLNVNYASDPYWGEKQAMHSFLNDKTYGSHDINSSTLGITNKSGVNIYHEPSTNSKVVLKLNNKYHDVNTFALTVYDRIINSEGTWYKVYTDCALDTNGNRTEKPYSALTSYGYIKEEDLYVENQQPSIEAKDITISVGDTYNLFKDVKTYDPEGENISESLDISETNLQADKPGTYYVTYVAYDSHHFEVHKTVNVTVTGNTSPTIKIVKDVVEQYSNIDPLSLVKAYDYDGKELTNITYTGSIDTNKVGTYEITYSVVNELNKEATLKLDVTVKANEKPIINAKDKIIRINTEYDPLEGVTATDPEEGQIKVVLVENKVDTTTPGTYEVTYKASDSHNATTQKTIKVTVSNKESKKSTFFFNYLKEIDNKLVLNGYAYLDSVPTLKDDSTKYTIIYHNIDTEEEITSEAQRIYENIPYNAISFDNTDHTYSWFNAVLDIDNIPNGNYYIYLKIETDDYNDIALIRNRNYLEEITSYTSIKTVTIRNDYSNKQGNLQLTIRSNKLIEKTAGFTYNEYQVFTKLEWDNNLINIRGCAYSYGMDMSKNVTKTLIFENQKTFKTYKYILDDTKGDYDVSKLIKDNISKDKAWYESYIDITNLESGTYTIYISLEANINDIAELNDRLYRDLSNLDKEIDGRTYKFRANKNKAYRVELTIE